MRIRFLSDQVYESSGPGKGPRFPKGLILDAADVGKALGVAEASDAYSEAFLSRWLQRGVAEEVDGRSKPDPEAIEAVAETVPDAPAEEPKEAPQPVSAAEISQPLGMARRGRPSAGNDR